MQPACVSRMRRYGSEETQLPNGESAPRKQGFPFSPTGKDGPIVGVRKHSYQPSHQDPSTYGTSGLASRHIFDGCLHQHSRGRIQNAILPHTITPFLVYIGSCKQAAPSCRHSPRRGPCEQVRMCTRACPHGSRAFQIYTHLVTHARTQLCCRRNPRF